MPWQARHDVLLALISLNGQLESPTGRFCSTFAYSWVRTAGVRAYLPITHLQMTQDQIRDLKGRAEALRRYL